MLIRCPKCGTGFNLPAEKIPAKGAKVKCSACTHTFRVRVGDGGEPVFFYKKGEAPTGRTMIGAPLDPEELARLGGEATAVAGEDSEHEDTQFGIPARSKSAREGYDPFPLAGKITGEQPAITDEQARNDRTQLLGSMSDVEELDEDDVFDEEDFANERTQLGPHGLAEDSANDRTKIGAPAQNAGPQAPPPLRTTEDDLREDDANERTQAFGSGGLDLFDGRQPERPSEPPPIDIDPFGDAFEEPVGDVGLLMPSTPTTEDPAFAPTSLAGETSSEVSMSEEDFLLGGGRSDFGDAASLVDQSFGDDVPSFDPQSGVVDVDKLPKSRRPQTGQTKSLRSHGEIELDDPRDEPAPRIARRASKPVVEERATRTAERPRARAAPAYVNQVGATSAARRAADVLLIGLLVGIGFVAVIASIAGGFVDFARFDHMLEVAFTDTEFVPREEWKQVVEIQPPDPPPDEPLRLHNVRAFEKQLDDRQLLVVQGKIRNYSLEEFKGVKVKAVVESGGEVIAERELIVGQSIDRKKFAAAQSVDAVKSSLKKTLPDVGKEGTTYFAIVFDDVPGEVVAGGRYDYSVEVVD